VTTDAGPDQEFYEALIDTSPLVVFRLDHEPLAITHVSENCRRVFGWDPAEVVAPEWSLADRIHGDDLPAAALALDRFLSDPDEPGSAMFRLELSTGRHRWVLARLRRDPARPHGYSGFLLDIHDRVMADAEAARQRDQAEEEIRRSEVFLASIIENIPNMVFVKDAEDLRFVRFNKAGEELIGRSREDLIGKTDHDLFPREQADAFVRADREVLDSGRLHDIPEEEIDTAHNGRRTLHSRKIPVLGPDGEPAYLLGISEDITDRRSADDALRVAKEDAERANRAKSEFLSRMSHELRTPLNSILGFGQLLELEDLDEGQAEAVTQILKGGRHLLELINEVLDISRIESGTMTLSLEPVALDLIIVECLDLVRPQALARRIELVNLDGRHRHVHADRQRLKQVLLNLLSNAVKFNRDGGTITVSCDHEPGSATITVTDTGPGIRPELQDRLFTPFDRLEADAAGIEGTGLGLALSRRLVEAMGGTIGVNSETAVGSTFSVCLPVGTVEVDADVERRQPPEQHDEAPTTTTVLYVEDNLANLRLVERILARRPGVRLVSALQGSIGLELAAQHRPDLVLLDVHLPDLGGDLVLQRLKADPDTAAIPVVVVSADATARQIKRFRQLGADDYLTKPLDVSAFLAVLDERLGAPPSW
jgi:PAS domain S-box-containing protein